MYPRKFDLLIVDEAHNCAPSGRGKYATDSLRTKALRLLAPHFEHKLFLTATPHNGYPESFSALLELLDNQRFARSTQPDRKQLDAVMVRRMKSELQDRVGRLAPFPEADAGAAGGALYGRGEGDPRRIEAVRRAAVEAGSGQRRVDWRPTSCSRP